MKKTLSRFMLPAWQGIWGITLIFLPVTSFPLLSRLAGGTLVAPLALLPLLLLCITFLPVYIINRKPFPTESRALFAFVIIALLASALAYFQDIPPYKGFTLQGNNLEAIVTLSIGLAFFFMVLLRNRSEVELNATLRFINIGGIVLLLWSLIQALSAWSLKGEFPDWIMTIQSFISISRLQSGSARFRILGMAYEPSWMANCLNILYLPLWLAVSATRNSSFHFRIWKLSVENFLLAAGVLVLILTYSRVGLLSFGLVLFWFMFLISKPVAARISARFFSQKSQVTKKLRMFIIPAMASILVLVVGGVAYSLSFNDSRYAKLFNLLSNSSNASQNFVKLANQLDIAERVMYWDLGWKVFESHPVLGVGLGNTGMFTLKNMSVYAWKLSELRRAMFIESFLPNSKCLWTRLLAETGLIGFAFFITWLLVLWFAGVKLNKHPSTLLRALGLAGQFTLVALILEGFSIDTFALPYLWIALGLLSAASALGRKIALGVQYQ